VKGTWAVLVFAMVWPTLAALGYFVGLASNDGAEAGANVAFLTVYVGSKIVQFSLPVLWLGIWQGQKLRPSVPQFGGLRLGLAFGLLVAGAMLALYFGELQHSSLLRDLPSKLHAKLADFRIATPLRFVLFGTFLTAIHSLLEEYYWRWFVFGELKRLVTLPPAIVISGLAFMAHHVVVLAEYVPRLEFMLTLSLGIAIGGMVWAWLYERTGSIWSAWLSHLVIDAAIIVIGYHAAFVTPIAEGVSSAP